MERLRRWTKKHGISIKQTLESPYSTDENLWGRSVECGELEDPWEEPPSDVWLWTAEPEAAPDKPAILEIGFENGIPVSLDGEKMGAVELVQNLSNLGGQHGIGGIFGKFCFLHTHSDETVIIHGKRGI